MELTSFNRDSIASLDRVKAVWINPPLASAIT